MKKHTKLCLGTIVFVVLFYQERPALNACLFAGVILAMLLISAKHKSIKTKWLSVCVVLSALSFAWYGDPYSFGALLFSLLAIGLSVQYRNLNIILYPVTGLINLLTFPFRIFFFKYWLPQKQYSIIWKKWIAVGLIPAVFVTLFICIYTSGSDHFSDFFHQFTFNFDIMEVLLLTCFGFFLMFNYWFIFIPREIIKIDQKLKDNFSDREQSTANPCFIFSDIDLERKSGEISLILLNILLLVFIITYNYEQFFTSPSSERLSDEIHQRIITIIGSIAMAIGVIMFYFKSTFNFDTRAGLLKFLTISWIILNGLLICSAITKNGEYILNYGLTFKRIGVFIFLALSLTGLYLTYLKLKNQKTNSFLVNRMGGVFFITFIVLSPVNFSWIVTRYNITFHKNDDITYLQSLDYNKQLLWNTYKNNPSWKNYFMKQKKQIQTEKEQNPLSTRLYYQFISW